MATFDGLGDDALITLCARVPFTSHSAVRCVNPRLDALLKSRAFRNERVKAGFAEHAVVAAGGICNGLHLADCWMLSGGPPQWRKITPLRVPRALACSAVYNGMVWLIGGMDATRDPLQSTEAWDPRTNTWSFCGVLNEGRYGAVAEVVGDSLVVAGGFSRGRRLATAEAYNPATGWVMLPPMPCPAYDATSCVLDGCLCVVGGAGSDQLQVWDGSEWVVRASLPRPRRSAAVVVRDGRVVVAGGAEMVVDDDDDDDADDDDDEPLDTSVGEENPTASVLTYDPRTDRWTRSAPLPEPRWACRSLEHAGLTLVIGGESQFCYVSEGGGLWAVLEDSVGLPQLDRGWLVGCYEPLLLG